MNVLVSLRFRFSAQARLLFPLRPIPTPPSSASSPRLRDVDYDAATGKSKWALATRGVTVDWWARNTAVEEGSSSSPWRIAWVAEVGGAAAQPAGVLGARRGDPTAPCTPHPRRAPRRRRRLALRPRGSRACRTAARCASRPSGQTEQRWLWPSATTPPRSSPSWSATWASCAASSSAP